MDETYSLMEFLQALATDTGLRDSFTHDPQAALHRCGLDHLSPADVHDALVLVEDNQTADFSRDYDTGSGGIHLPPPPVDHDFTSPEHFDQWIDIDSTVASGDGAVAAGGDIHGSTVTTGDHDTSAFGSGIAASTHGGGDVNVGDGGAFASGGSATVNNADHSQHGVGNSWTDNSVHDSRLDSSDRGVHDSGNTHLEASTHNSFDDNSEHTTTGSFDDESDQHVATDNGQHHAGDVDLQ